MKRFLLAAVIAALGVPLLAAAHNAYSAPHAPNATTVDEARYATPLSNDECQAAIENLPEDAAAWHTSVFTNVRLTAREREILDWFNADANLSRLRRQTHFHHYNRSMGVWPRYNNLTGDGLPVVVLQDATGRVIYKASGEDIPRAPWPLLKGIVECIRAHCPHCPRPRPTPPPDEPDEPLDEPLDKPVIPDVVGPNDNTPSDAHDDTVVVVIGAFAAAVAAGFLMAAHASRNKY